MASYHCTVKPGKSGQGQKHAVYICREGGYAKKGGDLEYVEHGNMPDWAREHPLDFWKAADSYERVNGRPYREIEIALPNELNPEQRRELVRAFVKEQLGEDHPYSYAIHCPKAALKKDTEQPHAHIMFSERKLDGLERAAEQFFKRANHQKPELGGTKKERDWQKKERLEQIRESWAVHQNRVLEKYGHRERVDHRSLEVQREEALAKGDFKKAVELDRPAELHLGPKVAQRTVRMAREHVGRVNTSAEVEQKRDEYYEKVELNTKAKNVFYLREYQRTCKTIEKEQEQLRKRSPQYRMQEIDRKLERLAGEHRAVAKKVIPPERARFIAQSVYTKGAITELVKEAQDLKKERLKYVNAVEKHQGQRPGFVEFNAKKAYELEARRLAQWEKHLQQRERRNQHRSEVLLREMATPEAQQKIAKISEGVLKKNAPYRQRYEALNQEINGLKAERAQIRREADHERSTKLRVSTGHSRKYTPARLTPVAHQLQKAVDRLDREQHGGKVMRVRIIKGRDEDEPSRNRGMER